MSPDQGRPSIFHKALDIKESKYKKPENMFNACLEFLYLAKKTLGDEQMFYTSFLEFLNLKLLLILCFGIHGRKHVFFASLEFWNKARLAGSCVISLAKAFTLSFSFTTTFLKALGRN